MQKVKEKLIVIRCKNKSLCKNRIIGELKTGSGGRLQCPRCKEYHYIDKAE